MKVLIDACVLFPTVLRELTLAAADMGAFQPLWSERILDEWHRAALRHSAQDGEIAAAEIAMVKARFPEAMVQVSEATEARLYLPDPGDIHVLAAAVDGGAGELLTLNIRDFPTNALSAEGLLRRHPDEFLLEIWHRDPPRMAALIGEVLDRAAGHGIDTSDPRKILKKARLPRLGKAMAQV